MRMITTEEIDEMAANIGSIEDFRSETNNAFGESEPEILSFLYQNSKEQLSENEKDLLFYMATVVWSIYKKEELNKEPTSIDHLAEKEEINWAVLEKEKGSLLKRMDAFFEGYPQEDLLAFVEDLVVHEEEELTEPGKEIIVICLKTIIDCLYVA